MNPYLTFSAVLACGLYGIKNKLTLTSPPLNTSKASVSSGPSQTLQRLPKTLEAAAAKMGAKDSMARKVLGDDFVDHYVGTRNNEVDLWNESVTDWEVRRYLELA